MVTILYKKDLPELIKDISNKLIEYCNINSVNLEQADFEKIAVELINQTNSLGGDIYKSELMIPMWMDLMQKFDYFKLMIN